jgi:hypothetical protein
MQHFHSLCSLWNRCVSEPGPQSEGRLSQKEEKDPEFLSSRRELGTGLWPELELELFTTALGRRREEL